MEKIYIGLSTKKGFHLGAKLIQFGEGSTYSHVYIRRKSDKIGEYIYQASAAGGVNFMGIDLFLEKNKIVEEYEFDITQHHLTNLVKFFIRNAGRKYSYKQILILASIVLAEKIGISCNFCKNIVINGKDEYICSELAAEVLSNIEGVEFSSLDVITPKKLQPYLKLHGKRVI